MLYNGIDLPSIDPVWDEATHPYAYVMEISPDVGTGAVYGLMLTNVELYKEAELGYAPHQNGEVKSFNLNGTLDGWNLLVTTNMTAGTQYFMSNEAVWCNNDILNADGSLYLAGSEPIDPEQKYSILAGTMAAIGLAIRKLKGNKTLYKPTEMPAAIEPDVVTAISYANWDSGKFTETLDNGSTLEYAVELEDGKPVKVTGPDGTETLVDWGNG